MGNLHTSMEKERLQKITADAIKKQKDNESIRLSNIMEKDEYGILNKISHEYKKINQSALSGLYHHPAVQYIDQDDDYSKKCNSLEEYVENINNDHTYPIKMVYSSDHRRGTLTGNDRMWRYCRAEFTWN
jgi:hypothetical protein